MHGKPQLSEWELTTPQAEAKLHIPRCTHCGACIKRIIQAWGRIYIGMPVIKLSCKPHQNAIILLRGASLPDQRKEVHVGQVPIKIGLPLET